MHVLSVAALVGWRSGWARIWAFSSRPAGCAAPLGAEPRAPDDLSRVDVAFFTLNGWVGCGAVRRNGPGHGAPRHGSGRWGPLASIGPVATRKKKSARKARDPFRGRADRASPGGLQDGPLDRRAAVGGTLLRHRGSRGPRAAARGRHGGVPPRRPRTPSTTRPGCSTISRPAPSSVRALRRPARRGQGRRRTRQASFSAGSP